MHKITDAAVLEHLANAPGNTITFELTQPGTVTLKLVRDASAAYLVVQADTDDETPTVALWRSKHNPTKEETRSEAIRMLEEYKANGGKITTHASNERRYTPRELKRIRQGLKVATPEEIKAETERRAIRAIENKDLLLAARLLKGEFLREIRFDIEENRIGPNGEIRNPSYNPGRNAVESK